MTYEYVCLACDKSLELKHGIKDDPVLECPFCGEKALQRLISYGNGFRLAGGCWERDGYGGDP